MAYERKCKNWLETFAQWSIPRSEAPETFIFWTGLWTLASVMRRQVQVPKRLLGSYSVAPNLYVIFVAPPAKARKSTTAGYAEDLLDEVDITHASSSMSQAVLMKRISESPDSAISILSSEFATFILKSGLDMFDFLTDLFDGKKKVTADTISRGHEFAEKPCVNLLAATTPTYISEGMPEAVIGGGFASRVIFIFENKVRRRQLFYENVDQKLMDSLRSDLIADLKHLTNIHGDFDIAPDAKDFLENWYKLNADKMPANQHRMHGYFERKPAHVLKLAQLLHLAESDTLIIERIDLERALVLLKQIEKNMPQAFSTIGKNKHTVEMDQIVAYIVEEGEVERSELLGEFYSAAAPNLLQELLGGLMVMDAIKTRMDKGKVYYTPGPTALSLLGLAAEPTVLTP